jgi:hypothetical protein
MPARSGQEVVQLYIYEIRVYHLTEAAKRQLRLYHYDEHDTNSYGMS